MLRMMDWAADGDPTGPLGLFVTVTSDPASSGDSDSSSRLQRTFTMACSGGSPFGVTATTMMNRFSPRQRIILMN